MTSPYNRSRSGTMVSQRKSTDHEQSHRDMDYRPKSIMKGRNKSARRSTLLTEEEKDIQIVKLTYMVQKLEERLKTAKVEAENAKRDLQNEIEGRKVVDKKLKNSEAEIKDLRQKMSSSKAKLGIVTANVNIGKHEADELRKSNQEHLIQIARLEERLKAANKEVERLRHPLNPDGSEEIKRRITNDKKEVKRLKTEVQKLQEQHDQDRQRLLEKDAEIKELEQELNKNYRLVDNLKASLEEEVLNAQAERSSREEFQRQNESLMKEKESFDEQIRNFKVKLSTTVASKNVNVKVAESLKKKDQDYQHQIRALEDRLKVANAEIDRLNAYTLQTGKTAYSMQEHKSRFKKHRGSFGVDQSTPRSFHTPLGHTPLGLTPAGLSPTGRGPSGWTPSRTPQRSPVGKSRVSLGSVNSVRSDIENIERKQKRVLPNIQSGKTPS